MNAELYSLTSFHLSTSCTVEGQSWLSTMLSSKRLWRLCLLAFLSAIHLTIAAPSFNPILPPSYPLAVKNPYLSGMAQRRDKYALQLIALRSMAPWKPDRELRVC